MDANARPRELVNEILTIGVIFNLPDIYLVENIPDEGSPMGPVVCLMFERAPENRIPVIVITTDGETIQGSVRMTLSNKLSDAINSVEPFFDFVTAGGERFFIAKHCVRRIETFEIPRADHLSRREKNTGDFDPHKVLGLPRGANLAAIKQAYHTLARAYHPDRFAGIELPPEMHDYATAMLARINLAYRQLQGNEVKSAPANGNAASQTAPRR